MKGVREMKNEVEIEKIYNGYLVYSDYPNTAYIDQPHYFETLDEVSEFLKTAFRVDN